MVVKDFFRNESNFFYGWNLSAEDRTLGEQNVFKTLFGENVSAPQHLDSTWAKLRGIELSGSVGLKKTDMCSYDNK